MTQFFFRKQNPRTQYLTVIATGIMISLIGLSLHNLIGYRVVAFLLLVGVFITESGIGYCFIGNTTI